MKALDAALDRARRGARASRAALRAADHDPHELERIEERLFALRAAGRKYNVAGRRARRRSPQRYAADLALIDAGAERLAALEAAAREAEALSQPRRCAVARARKRPPTKLDKAVNGELKPLKLERAKFSTQIESDAAAAGPHGIDRVEFWVQTNPGTRPGPLMKVASGGELARFLLALKVVLADRGSAPTLVFDEIEHQRRRRAAIGEHDLEGEQEARELAARGDLHQRPRPRARIGLHPELDAVDAVRAGRAASLSISVENLARSSLSGLQLGVDRLVELSRRPCARAAESAAAASR